MSKTITTGEVRFSYLHVLEAASINGSEPKFSACIIVDKNDAETLNKIKDAVSEATQDGISDKWKGKKPANLKTPLRDGDDERPDDPAFKNAYFLNANNKSRPGVVDADKQEILDPNRIYSGVYGRASLSFYPYDANGNRGVACGLNHIQSYEYGEKLSGGPSVDEAFGD